MSANESLVGKQIGQYRLDQFIARGAVGSVFKAWDTALDRTFALKIISIDVGDTTAASALRDQLYQEVEAATRLSHPHILPVHSLGESEGLLYICMEYVPGRSLAEILQDRKTLSPHEAAVIFGQVLSAVEAAHRQNIVHRDIKPSNIMVSDEKKALLMGYGTSKVHMLPMADTMKASQKPDYTSPELIRGETPDIRADIFSLGSALYEALSGAKPFEAESTAKVAEKILQADPIPLQKLDPRIPRSLDVICQKAMGRDPVRRYQSPTEMLMDLNQVLEEDPTGKTEREDADTTIVGEKPRSVGAPVSEKKSDEHPGAPDSVATQPVRKEPQARIQRDQTLAEPRSQSQNEARVGKQQAPPPEAKPVPEGKTAAKSAPPERKGEGLKVFLLSSFLLLILAAGAYWVARETGMFPGILRSTPLKPASESQQEASQTTLTTNQATSSAGSPLETGKYGREGSLPTNGATPSTEARPRDGQTVPNGLTSIPAASDNNLPQQTLFPTNLGNPGSENAPRAPSSNEDGLSSPPFRSDRIRAGMSPGEVRQILGEPTQVKPLGKQIEWEYDTPKGVYEVRFLSNKVVYKKMTPYPKTRIPKASLPSSASERENTTGLGVRAGSDDLQKSSQDLKVGMTNEQVRGIMGEPSQIKPLGRKVEWEYFLSEGMLEVLFEKNRVVGVRKR